MSATDAMQPGERQRPDWLLDEIRRSGPHDLRGLATPRNLSLLADEIAQLQQERAAAPDIAAERINTLTRELSRARTRIIALRAKRSECSRIVGLLRETDRTLTRELAETRALLAEYGWVYFRVEDPANPIRRDGSRPVRRGRTRPAKLPPGKYVQMCRVCGALRSDGHAPECKIGRALAPYSGGCCLTVAQSTCSI